MPLYPYMLQTVIRVSGDRWDEATGNMRRRPLGTAFLIQVESESVEGGWYPYVVTAHHVIDGQPNPELAFADPHKPGTLYPPVATSGPDWRHPIEDLDLAVLPFVRPDGYFIFSLLAGQHLLPELPPKAMLAQTFHYVGLLVEPVNRPMARSGTLGAVYEPGIKDGMYEYTAHLGDCRSYGGFSGSPCFLELALPGLTPAEPPVEPPTDRDLGPMGRMNYVHLLCGMLTFHLERTLEGREASVFGVAAILTSDDIWRVLMSDELVEDRQRRDAMGDVPEAKMMRLGTGDRDLPPQG